MKTSNTRKPHRERVHLIRKIGATSSFNRKFDLATGRSIYMSGIGSPGQPETDEEIFELIRRARHAWLLKDTTETQKENDEYFLDVIMLIGQRAIRAIQKNDARFFQLMAGALQSKSPKDMNKLYAMVVNYCCERSIGTEEKPCGGPALAAFLRKKGFYESAGNYSNEIPRALRTLCNKMGIVLSKGKSGRRPANKHR